MGPSARMARCRAGHSLDAVERSLAEALEASLGSPVRSSRPLGGGDVAQSYRVELGDGRRVFAKAHRSPPPGFFVTEAVGLRWLADADAVPVPEVLAVADGGSPAGPGPVAFLALAWIDEAHGRPSPAAEAELGRSLAMLHRAGAPAFGRQDRRPTGSRSLPNEPCGTWPEFYATRRLLPLARAAADAGALPAADIAGLEQVAAGLDRHGAADEGPCRLHGDLWAGNRLVDTAGVSWLIDPSAHGGHREFDLAMMRLFGGFGAACFEAYGEAFPLAAGWQERVALHQIAPLVVHAIKFGGGYVAAAGEAIARYR
jgi:fructosamine-3-kinase